MGQASLNKQNAESMEKKLLEVDVAGIAAAIRKLATASSSKYLGDCYLHVAMAKEMLQAFGVVTRIAAGESAWRVGDADGDVISHRKEPGVIYSPESLPAHVWLTCGRYILDITTYQLKDKARSLDVIDGGKTNVDWCPDYLLATQDQVSSYMDTANLKMGTFHYRHDAVTTSKVIAHALPLDPEDLDNAWLIYRNPHLLVLGPNNLGP